MFNKRQQRGIFLLLILLVILLGLRFYYNSIPPEPLVIDQSSNYQQQIDSIRKTTAQRKDTIYVFNPNYITEYRGYRLGLNEAEMDRLVRFRESGKFINTAAQFKEVTQVSDVWMDSISPYFKFPSWTTRSDKPKFTSYRAAKIIPKDINTATVDQLKKVYGIGPALSTRIVEQRERLKGFVDFKQVAAVYGLSDSTMLQLEKHFYLEVPASFKKIALNTATSDRLSTIPYLSDYLVDALIEQRTLRDGFSSWDEVLLTSRFPQEKLELIQLYLTID